MVAWQVDRGPPSCGDGTMEVQLRIQRRQTQHQMIVSGLLLLTVIALSIHCSQAVLAASEQQPDSVSPSRLEGLILQPGDEPLKTFVPRNPPNEQSRLRGDALAHFMTGRIQQEKGNFSAALDSYLAAAEKDPAALEPYQSAIPILLQRQENDRARELAITASEKNPKGYELVLAMAAILVRQDKLDDGLKLLQATLDNPNKSPNRLRDLTLRRDLGLYHRLRGEYKVAAEQYEIVFNAIANNELNEADRQSLLVDPGQMYDEFGDVFLKAENPELALKAFDEASKYRETRPGLNSYNLATVFRQTGKPERALEELQEYFNAQLQTRGQAAYQLLKDLLADLNREDELIPRLEELRKVDEHNDSLRFFLADAYLDKGDLERAQELYLNGRKDPNDPRGLVGMFAIYRQNKNSEKIFGILGKLFAAVPRAEDQNALQQMAPDVQALARRFDKEVKALLEDKEAFESLTQYAKTQEKDEDSRFDFLTAYLLGKLASEGHYTDDAIYFYKLAISMRNDPPGALFRELAIYLVDENQVPKAIEVLNDALSHSSATLKRERWNFLYLISFAYALDGETDKALSAIRDAQQLQPNQPLLKFQEGWILLQGKRHEEALAHFERFIKNFPQDKSNVMKARFYISNIYVEMDEMEKGEKILEDILAEDPDNPQANNDLGYLWADQGKNLERAEKMIRKALEHEPDNRAYQDSLGWVLYRLGRYEEAVVEMEKATADVKKQDPTLMDHLGDTLIKVGREEEAIQAWKKALELEQAKKNPSEKILKSLKEKLKIPEEPQQEKS